MNNSKPIYIRFVKRGLANRFDYGDYEEIEIHHKLTQHPKLYKGILEHELKHERGGYKLKDLKHDLGDGLKKSGLTWFILKNPSTLLQLSPIWFKNKRVYFDWSNLIMWGIFLIFGVASYFVLNYIAGVILWLAH